MLLDGALMLRHAIDMRYDADYYGAPLRATPAMPPCYATLYTTMLSLCRAKDAAVAAAVIFAPLMRRRCCCRRHDITLLLIIERRAVTPCHAAVVRCYSVC